MTKNVVVATLVSSILGLAMIGGAVYWKLADRGNPPSAHGSGVDAVGADRSFTLRELARYDGEGDECLVAVDGEVYLIEGFDLWKDGGHAPSGGRARCGLDLTEVMDQEAPHGRSKLQLLKKVGTLR